LQKQDRINFTDGETKVVNNKWTNPGHAGKCWNEHGLLSIPAFCAG